MSQARFRLSTRRWVSVGVVVVLMLGSFWVGDRYHGYVWNPLRIGQSSLDLSSLNDLYNEMQTKFDGHITAQQAIDGAREGLVAAGGDPYTVYLTPQQAKALNDDLQGTVTGVGIEVGLKNNLITVISPVKGSPAESAGIRSGDVIVAIDGQDATSMGLDQAVTKIRGKVGTKVTLKVARSGSDTALSFTITRATITVPSVTWSMKGSDIGYIVISRFGPDTAQLTDKAAGDLKSKGAKKIILDLRNNGGGYLDAGVAVASEFLQAGKTVVSERTDGKTVDTLTSSGSAQLVGLPTIVLINGGSASASEIVSGALHDNGAAKLYGQQSFGKGSVQEIENEPGGAELKITIAHWYTPGGININKTGLTPDVKVDLTNDDYNHNRDPQLDVALKALR